MESFQSVLEQYLKAPSADGLTQVEKNIQQQRRMQNQPRIYRWFLSTAAKTFVGVEQLSEVQGNALFSILQLVLPFYVFSAKHLSDYVTFDYCKLLKLVATSYVNQREMKEGDKTCYFQQVVRALFCVTDPRTINIDGMEGLRQSDLYSALFRILDLVEKETITRVDVASLGCFVNRFLKEICESVVSSILAHGDDSLERDYYCLKKVGPEGATQLLHLLLHQEDLEERPASVALIDVNRRWSPIIEQLGKPFLELIGQKNTLEVELDSLMRQYYVCQEPRFLDAAMHVLRTLGPCPLGQLRKDAIRRLLQYQDFETEIVLFSAGQGIPIECLLQELKTLARGAADTLKVPPPAQRVPTPNSTLLKEVLGADFPPEACVDLEESVAVVRIVGGMEVFVLRFSLELLLVYRACFSIGNGLEGIDEHVVELLGRERFSQGLRTLQERYFLVEMRDGQARHNEGFGEIYEELRHEVLRIDAATEAEKAKEDPETRGLMRKAELIRLLKQRRFLPISEAKEAFGAGLIEELLEQEELFLDEHATLQWEE